MHAGRPPKTQGEWVGGPEINPTASWAWPGLSPLPDPGALGSGNPHTVSLFVRSRALEEP